MANPTLTISTDKPSYSPGDTVTLTAVFADSQTVTLNVTVSATATGSAGDSVQASTGFQVVTTGPEPMTVTVTDDHSDTWTQVSDDGKGTVVFTTTAPSS